VDATKEPKESNKKSTIHCKVVEGGGGGGTGAQTLLRVRKAAPLHIGDEMTQKSRIGHG